MKEKDPVWELKNKRSMGLKEAAWSRGVSETFMRNAANDPDPARRLRTFRLNRRRLVTPEDVEDWWNRVAREEEVGEVREPRAAGSAKEAEAAA